MTEKIIIAGAGGQGIMLLGKVLAEAAMREDRHVTWLPAYGAEVRGGTAHCMVTVSDQEIGSPYINEADTLIIMNSPSFHKFKDRLKNGGLLIVNSSLVSIAPKRKSGAQILAHPFTDIAVALGNIKVANMVALGCFIARRGIIGSRTICQAMQAMAPANRQDLISLNQKALFAGAELIKKT